MAQPNEDCRSWNISGAVGHAKASESGLVFPTKQQQRQPLNQQNQQVHLQHLQRQQQRKQQQQKQQQHREFLQLQQQQELQQLQQEQKQRQALEQQRWDDLYAMNSFGVNLAASPVSLIKILL